MRRSQAHTAQHQGKGARGNVGVSRERQRPRDSPLQMMWWDRSAARVLAEYGASAHPGPHSSTPVAASLAGHTAPGRKGHWNMCKHPKIKHTRPVLQGIDPSSRVFSNGFCFESRTPLKGAALALSREESHSATTNDVCAQQRPMGTQRGEGTAECGQEAPSLSLVRFMRLSTSSLGAC